MLSPESYTPNPKIVHKNWKQDTLPGAGFAVAIEALSWMAYAGMGERTALFKAASQLGVKRADELRQAHKLIMETTRYQNRLEHLITQVLPEEEFRQSPHGITSFLKILAYLRYIDGARPSVLQRQVGLGRQILGWKELQPYEMQIALIVAGKAAYKADALDELEELALETCHPPWFVKRTVHVFGRKTALQILQRNLQPLPSYARINDLKTTDDGRRATIVKQLGDEVVGLPGVVRLTRKERPFQYLESGEVVLQDLASIIVGLVANPRPGETVLDLCAAPGNKTTHLAALMRNQGKIYSIDVSSRRLSRWRKEMSLCGCDMSVPIRADARRIPLKIAADIVLIDPPCSNTGVFARNPAGKWRLSPARINELTLKQGAILQAGSNYVMPNGTLVYCTCSILPEENEFVIESFLRKNPEFQLIPQHPFFGSRGLRGLDLCQRLYSYVHHCNGFFIARLQRKI